MKRNSRWPLEVVWIRNVEVRAARNTAVLSLAQDLPAPVVSELLDLHIGTAVYWGKRGGRDWTSYLEARRSGASPGVLR